MPRKKFQVSFMLKAAKFYQHGLNGLSELFIKSIGLVEWKEVNIYIF